MNPNELRPMRLTELISTLQIIKDEYGDCIVTQSIDEEGNGYSAICMRGIAYDPKGKELCFYPVLVRR